MVQFLSIIFFLGFFNFCWVFQKFPFFLCHPLQCMAFKASDSFTYRKDRSCPVKFYLVTHTHSRESAPSRRKFDSDKKIRVPYSFWLQRIPLQNLQPYVNFRPLWEKRGYNVGQSKEAVRVTQVGVRWRHSKPQRFATFRKLTVTAILQDTSCKVCVEGVGWHRHHGRR